MITKTINTLSGKVKVSLPTNLNEITIGQMIDMVNHDPKSGLIPLIPDLTKEILDNIIDFNQLLELQQRVLSLVHQIKYCYNGAELPEYVYFGQKKVKVIRNLSIEPAGAFLASRDIIATDINKHIEMFGEDDWKANFNPDLNAMAMVLAHYFYCRVTGNLYVEQLAEEFKSEVLKLPLQTGLPIARHFFLSYPNLLKQRIRLWDRLRLSWKNARALRRLKNSASTTQ